MQAVLFVQNPERKMDVLSSGDVRLAHELGRRLLVVDAPAGGLGRIARLDGVTVLDGAVRAVPHALSSSEAMSLKAWYDAIRPVEERPGERISWGAPEYEAP